MAGFHLANFNVARMRVPTIEDPLMGGFVSRLAEINAIAEKSPGFVWRLHDDAGDATSIRPYEDDRILINLTVWESAEALADFVYHSRHGELVRDGRKWFLPPERSSLVLWWMAAGETPTLADAVARLDRVNREGPSPEAFTFRDRYPPPSSSAGS